MKQLTNLLGVAMLAFLASGCQLSVPNVEVCRDKSILGARCNWTEEGNPRDIPLEEWNEYRIGQFCMTEEAFAKNQKFIEQACERTNGCSVAKLRAEYRKIINELQ